MCSKHISDIRNEPFDKWAAYVLEILAEKVQLNQNECVFADCRLIRFRSMYHFQMKVNEYVNEKLDGGCKTQAKITFQYRLCQELAKSFFLLLCVNERRVYIKKKRVSAFM